MLNPLLPPAPPTPAMAPDATPPPNPPLEPTPNAGVLLGAATGAPNVIGAGLALDATPNDTGAPAPNDGAAEDAGALPPNPPVTAGAGLGAPNMDVAADGAGAAGAEAPKPKPPAAATAGEGAPNVVVVDEPKLPLEGAAGAGALLAPNVNVPAAAGAGAELDPKVKAGFEEDVPEAEVAAAKAGGSGAIASSSNLLGLLFTLPNATLLFGAGAAPNVNGAGAAELPEPEAPKVKLGLLLDDAVDGVAVATAAEVSVVFVLAATAALVEVEVAPKLKPPLIGIDAGAGAVSLLLANDDLEAVFFVAEDPKVKELALVFGAGAALALGAPNENTPAVAAGVALVVFLLASNPNIAGAGTGAGAVVEAVLPKEKATPLRFLAAGSSAFDDDDEEETFSFSSSTFALSKPSAVLFVSFAVVSFDVDEVAPKVKPLVVGGLGVLLEEVLPLPTPKLKPPLAAAAGAAAELFVLSSLLLLLPPKVKPLLEDAELVVAPPKVNPPAPMDPGALGALFFVSSTLAVEPNFATVVAVAVEVVLAASSFVLSALVDLLSSAVNPSSRPLSHDAHLSTFCSFLTKQNLQDHLFF